jgi:hypothetical protein
MVGEIEGVSGTEVVMFVWVTVSGELEGVEADGGGSVEGVRVVEGAVQFAWSLTNLWISNKLPSGLGCVMCAEK